MNFSRVYIFLIALVLSNPYLTPSLALGINDETANAPTAASRLSAAFEEKGFKFGSPVFLRVYKQSSELELWVQRGSRYALFKTYGICRWSGSLGPKMHEGDRQSPEGLYHISAADLIVNPRWHRAMNINYPNSYDVFNGRSGSGILIHGKCASIGCFALRDENVEEVFESVRAALQSGQGRIPVLSLPFKFASVAVPAEETPEVNEFWGDLRRADYLFQRDRLPPTALLCDGRYFFADRRGDRHRHAVHMPGCQPLDKPVSVDRTADLGGIGKSVMGALSASAGDPKQAVQKAAQSCNPRDVKCRLLRVAVKSNVICPQKYGRCRTAQAAYTKSVECPLKYPRCRWFVGPDPHGMRSAGITRIKR